ncbi:ribosomal-protein-alanine acetyltransferase [Novosphingobium marinum]|uniref:Ribosomal-protein-alanine N-acetyltransferase n=1 Tax=Novosphingobium marinum TaxID=1514948 RepID=A0A7Y9XXQ2_9SPHN|nr:GNAT family N-acetyltransferase [Novosphingobium marinum]NYH96482.1 ribosomal-protein-alanine N-acetyltransferase [Novosphingobium marinum]GGC35590.1 ribosomal-protein-alanine acetyltransferase [Novosphingobium marinum]
MMLEPDDLDRIMAIMEAAFDPLYGEAWTRTQVESAFNIGNCHCLLFGAHGQTSGPGDEAIGFCITREGFGEEELLLLAVIPEYRGKGIGRAMLACLSGEARARGSRSIFLEMRRGNPAESLYTSFGFRPVGERPRYYRRSDGERIDAITFLLKID